MKIIFISVGVVKKDYIKEGVRVYVKRIKRYVNVESVDIKEERAPKKGPRQDQLKKEAERVLAHVKKNGFMVVLGEQGKAFTSAGLSRFIEGFMGGGQGGRDGRGGRDLYFITGGPFGLHGSVAEAADLVMSLSEMTLPHDLARLVLVEQVYRAFTIIRGEPYSH